MVFSILATLLAPWMALAALVRQREAWAQEQALAFELERSELARQALEARMRLLAAQVQPHFLFNTLANVQALVENAVRHGIDPAEDGGHIDIRAEVRTEAGVHRCHLSFSDTGVGLQPTGGGLGTGLAALRERLQLVHGSSATLTLAEVQPHGLRESVEFPAIP